MSKMFTRRHSLIALSSSLLGLPAAHADLSDLRQKGVLKVALYKNNLPFSDGSASGATGVEADLALALAKQLQLNVQWLPFEAGENMEDDLRNMVWKGHYLGFGPADVLMQVPIDRFLVDKTPQCDFLRPYYRHRLVWLTQGKPSADDLKALALDGISLGAEIATAASGALAGLEGGKYKPAIHHLPTGLEAAQGVVTGRWQAAYVTQAQAEAAIKGLPDRDRYLIQPAALRGTPPNGWAVGMAIKSKQPELSAALNQALKTLADNGTLDALFQKNGLTRIVP